MSPKTGKPPEHCPGCGYHFGGDPAFRSLQQMTEASAIGERRMRRMRQIAVGVALVISMTGGFLTAPDGMTAYGMGKGLGNGLVVLVVACLLAGLAAAVLAIFRKPFARVFGSAFPAFAILLACGHFAVSFALKFSGDIERDRTMERNTISTIRRATEQFERDFEAANEAGQMFVFDISGDPPPRNKWEAMIAISRNKLKWRADFQNAHVRGLQEAGFPNILDPERLAKDEGLVESKAIIARTRAFLEGQREQLEEMAREWPAFIRSMPHAPTRDQEWMRGIEGGIRETKRRTKEFVDEEAAIVNRVESMLIFLASKEGQWSCQQGELVFESAEDLVTYDQHLLDLAQVIGEQKTNEQNLREHQDRVLDKAESL